MGIHRTFTAIIHQFDIRAGHRGQPPSQTTDHIIAACHCSDKTRLAGWVAYERYAIPQFATLTSRRDAAVVNQVTTFRAFFFIRNNIINP